MSNEFHPQSTDAMFAKILAELQGVQTTMAEVRDEVKKTNGRVRGLEMWRTEVRASTAVIASIVSGVVGLSIALLSR